MGYKIVIHLPSYGLGSVYPTGAPTSGLSVYRKVISYYFTPFDKVSGRADKAYATSNTPKVSSVVERSTVNRYVVGSTPILSPNPVRVKRHYSAKVAHLTLEKLCDVGLLLAITW